MNLNRNVKVLFNSKRVQEKASVYTKEISSNIYSVTKDREEIIGSKFITGSKIVDLINDGISSLAIENLQGNVELIHFDEEALKYLGYN